LTPHGKIFSRSDATLFIMEKLGGSRRILGRLAGLLPSFILDTGYRFVATIRHRIFPAPNSACPIVPLEIRKRFLP
ncbi:MAG: thiol-disulfide oxidoreductase, partial [Candidatus Sumerlaeota bacterium]